MNPPEPPILDVQHLYFSFGAQCILDHIDLQVQRGTTLGVIGPNGGGKTTLLRLILGLLKPTRGRIVVDGLGPQQALARGDVIGYLPQHPAVPAGFPISVRQVARLGLAGKTGMLRSAAREDLAFVDQLLERVGLADRAEAPIGSLSGGQLQRALIARALAARPKVLLLDEPTTGVDRSNQQRFIRFLQELKASLGLTVVLVSHDLRAVSSLADRIACLDTTLHYHDVPDRMPEELVYRMFACDLEAMGIAGRGKTCCSEHPHDPQPQSAP